MKVFWSWQSDAPGKTGRHFVREALAAAIETLKQPPDIEEPSERERREAMHVDQDRAGVPGSPDLARTILDKIDASSVFVADVTPVGATFDETKKLMNPNVAIELGFSLKALTDRALVMVMNEHYGTRDDLPFDLRHKAGPIRYRLAPEADKKAIEAAKRRLAGEFVIALRPYLSASAATSGPTFKETQPKSNPAVYFDIGEHLARVGVAGIDEVQYSYSGTNGLYLRLIPTKTLAEPIRLSQLLELANSAPFLQPLCHDFRQSFRKSNKHGVIIFEPDGSPNPKFSTQVFHNGEIWGFNPLLLSHRELGGALLPSEAIELTFRLALHQYLEFAVKYLKIDLPYTVEAGITGIEGAHIAVLDYRRWGPIHQPHLSYRAVLHEISEQAGDRFLLDFFQRMYDLTGYPRPKGLYNFPAD